MTNGWTDSENRELNSRRAEAERVTPIRLAKGYGAPSLLNWELGSRPYEEDRKRAPRKVQRSAWRNERWLECELGRPPSLNKMADRLLKQYPHYWEETYNGSKTGPKSARKWALEVVRLESRRYEPDTRWATEADLLAERDIANGEIDSDRTWGIRA